MPFFRLQNQARRRSLRLLLLYAAAVVGTVFTVSAVLGSLLLLGWSRADPFWSYAAPALMFVMLIAAALFSLLFFFLGHRLAQRQRLAQEA